MSIFSRARSARSTLNQLNQAQPPQPGVAQRLFTKVQQAQQQLGQQNPQPAPMVPPPGMPQVSPSQTSALTQLLSQARMQSPDIGALPQGMSGRDPRAIAANPQGFKQYMAEARQQEAQMPGSPMLGNTSSGTFGPQMSPLAQYQLDAQRGMSSGGLGMQQQISPFAQAGYEAQMAGPNPYAQGLGSSSSPFAQYQLDAQRGMSSGGLGMQQQNIPSGMLGGGLGALPLDMMYRGGPSDPAQQAAVQQFNMNRENQMSQLAATALQNMPGRGLQGAFGSPQQSSFGTPQQSSFGGQQSTPGMGLQGVFGSPQQSSFGSPQQSSFGSPQQSSFGSPQQSSFGGGLQGMFSGAQQSPSGSPQQSSFGGGPTQQAQGPTGQQAPRQGLF